MTALFDRSEMHGCVSYSARMLTGVLAGPRGGKFQKMPLCGSGLHAPCGEPKPAIGGRWASIFATPYAAELNDGR
jgi:hypothetical protein